MLRWQRVVLGVLIAVVVVTGAAVIVRANQDDTAAPEPTTTTSSTTSTVRTTTSTTVATTTTTAAPTTTTAPPIPWPALPTDGVARAITTPTGIVLAVLRRNADGSVVARAPCGGEATVRGTPISGATIVLDPGHGGDEPGAVGPTGLLEKAVNLAVAKDVQAQLQAKGAAVVLTRTGDYRITLASRRAIADALHPTLFLSIHHNAEPDGPHDGPGGETYFQIRSADSKRAAGLIYEEEVRAFSAYKIAWTGDRDAGAKYRLKADGTDYYGILHGVTSPSVLSEAAFITNPPEEHLLADPAFQQVEAGAIARAITRYVATKDPGSGFTTPYPRTVPAGPGGGSSGCVDPPLG